MDIRQKLQDLSARLGIRANGEANRDSLRHYGNATKKTEIRALGETMQNCVAMARKSYAASYAVLQYNSYFYPDILSDDAWYALRDAMDCCDLLNGLAYRESDLMGEACELCVAACDAAVAALAAATDPMLKACSEICSQCSAACKPAADTGEADEGRSLEQRGAADEKLEVRNFKFEVRRAEGEAPKITGKPIVFRCWSQDLGGFREMIEPDAVEFDDPLRADFDHDSKYILGTESRGTLKMTRSEDGWEMMCMPPDTQWARDLMTSIERGDIEGGSFAFQVSKGGQKWSQDGTQRTLTAIKVRRVSVVSDPAYLQTNGSFQVRSVNDILADRPEQRQESQQTETAGQAAPPAKDGGGVDIDLLRRNLELSLSL